jgi:hypothetical protein
VGETYPPKKSKWDKVQYAQERVVVDRVMLTARNQFGMMPKQTTPFVKEDLPGLPAPPSRKWTHALAGIGCSGARPMMSANNPYVQGKALLGRVFLKQEKAPWGRGPQPGLWKWAEKFVDVLLPEFRAARMDFEEWLDSMPGRRRKALRVAAVKYHRTGFKGSYRKFKAFVKAELLPGFAKRGGHLDRLLEMLDRLIQGPNDVTHCIAGPYLKPLVHRLKEVWGPEDPIFYGSACPEALHQFLQRLIAGAGVFFWCDFSMFDCTHSKESWAFMRHLYKRAGISDPEFWRVMDAWEQPQGSIGPFKYRARTMNASGRDDTALANGILNGFATYLSACAAYLAKPLLELTLEDVRACKPVMMLSVCGDDSIGKLPLISNDRRAQFAEDMAVNIRMFGFEAKLCMSDNILDAVYLGMRPLPAAGGTYWARTIGRATFKMGWVKEDPGRDVMAHVTGIADMHARCSAHVPILADLANKIVELRAGAKRTPVELDPNRPWEWTHNSRLGDAVVKYDLETIAAVARTYTSRSSELNLKEADQVVTIADVLDLISTIRRVEKLPCVVDHWLWRRMVLLDDL